MTHDIAKIDNYSVYRRLGNNSNYTTLTDFSTKYFMMCKVYTDVGGIK